MASAADPKTSRSSLETSSFSFSFSRDAETSSETEASLLSASASASFFLSNRRAARRAAGASGPSLPAVSFFFCKTSRTRALSSTPTTEVAGASSPNRPETYAYAPRLAPAAKKSARNDGETPPRLSGGRGVPEGTDAGVPCAAPPFCGGWGEDDVVRGAEDAPPASAEDADGAPEGAPAGDDADEADAGASAAGGFGGARDASPGLGLW